MFEKDRIMLALAATGLLLGTFGFVVLLVGCGADAPSARAAAALSASGGEIHGYVSVLTPLKTRLRLPNASVYIKDHTTGRVIGARVKSDGHGRFLLPRANIGTYDLCVEGFGLAGSCPGGTIPLTVETYNKPGDREVSPTGGVLWGTVLFADGNVPYHESRVTGKVTTTTVTLTDSLNQPVTRPVTANDRGEFLLSGITTAGAYKLTATCEGVSVSRSLTFSLEQRAPVALTLPNRVPQIVSVVGAVGGLPVRHGSPGDVVQATVTAADLNGDALKYAWADGTPSFVSSNAPQVSWTLPGQSATAALFVEVGDGKGGYAIANLPMSTSQLAVLIGGTTMVEGGGVLGGVKVSVNGSAPVLSDSQGHFQLRVQESNRYVVNGTKSTFALASQVVYSPTGSVVLKLAPAQRFSCDAQKDCVARFKMDRKGVAAVAIVANTLVDKKSGKPASGPLFVDLFNFALNRSNAMPGDYSAIDRNGKSGALISQGAINVDISDASGNHFTIASGKSALISIPVDPTIAAPPASIPLWEYDEDQGLWIEKSVAAFNSATGSFEGKVPGFSAWNADTVFSDTACIKFTMNPAAPPPFPFILHVSMPVSAGPVRHNDFTISENVNGLFRLPANADVTFEVHPASGPDATLSSITVKSGAAIDAEFQGDPWNGFPPFDYSACKGFDPASALPGQPVRLSMNLPGHTAPWLSPFISAPPYGVGDDATSRAYYSSIAGVTIDPATNACTGAKCTLAGFQTANHMATDYSTTNVPASGEVVTYFYNAGDLGLGREMHCKKNGSNVACYVTNYGHNFPPAAEPNGAIADAIAHDSPIATVAMEYDDAPATPGTGVQFYVYPAGQTLATKAALDSEGPKNMPQLCMACHGGSYDAGANKVVNAAFREFDLFSYQYDQNPATGYTQANQEESFRILNDMVKGTHPNENNSNHPITALIDGMYPCGVSTAGCASSNSYTPPNWNGSAKDRNLYQTIPRVYCRACHIAQPSYMDWTDATGFTSGFLQSPVCGTYDMPHGEVPFRKFWLSTNPSGPAFLADPTTGINIAGGCPPP